MELLQPKPLELGGKTYMLSKLPATDGRELVTQYPVTMMPKVGDYAVNEQLMLKLMCFVEVENDNGSRTRLSTKTLVNQHVPDWEVLAKIEIAMMEYNVSFFGNGKASGFLKNITQNAQAFLSKTLMDSLAPLLKAAKPPSGN